MIMANTDIVIEKGWLKRFLPVWIGQLFSLLGSGLVQFAIIWYLTSKTGSAIVLATATFVSMIPEVFIGPFAGALVDRWNRRKVMIFADVGIAAVTFGLAVLFFTGLIQTWHIYVVLFLRTIGGLFHWPAMQASTSLMVPEKHLARVYGINSGLRGGLNIVAPPLGALLMSVIPMYGVISIDVLTAMLAVIPLLFIVIPQPAAARSDTPITPRQLTKDVVEGFRYIIAWRGALYICLLATAINFLLTPSNSLLPLLVTGHFQGGVWELSMVEAATGFGVVLGGLALGIWGGFRKKIYTSLFGIAGIGLGVAITGLIPAGAFGFAIAGMALTGFMGPMTDGPLFAILQARVAPEIQGRVFASIGAFARAMAPISLLVAGPMAETFGVRSWFVVGGIVCFLLVIVAASIPDIIRIEEKDTISQLAVAVE